MTKYICTIITKNFVSMARILAKSFLEHHHDGKVYVLLVDETDGNLNQSDEPFELIPINKLMEPFIKEMLFRYHASEAAVALKPYILLYLLRKLGLDKVVFLDADMLIIGDLDEVYRLLDSYSIILTPQFTSPIQDDPKVLFQDFAISRTGVFNTGFVALSRDKNSLAFLNWWASKLYHDCLIDFNRGLFIDQKWLDAVPGLFSGVFILRDLRYNFQVKLFAMELYKFPACDKSQVRIFHFSGGIYKEENSPDPNAEAIPIKRQYQTLLALNGYEETRKFSYAYDYYSNGEKITSRARLVFRELGARALKFGDPFSAGGKNTYYYWLNKDLRELINVRLVLPINDVYKKLTYSLKNAFHIAIRKILQPLARK
jgi:lipopolysaccharide biosynthesis glycosyltransferase